MLNLWANKLSCVLTRESILMLKEVELIFPTRDVAHKRMEKAQCETYSTWKDFIMQLKSQSGYNEGFIIDPA